MQDWIMITIILLMVCSIVLMICIRAIKLDIREEELERKEVERTLDEWAKYRLEYRILSQLAKPPGSGLGSEKILW